MPMVSDDIPYSVVAVSKFARSSLQITSKAPRPPSLYRNREHSILLKKGFNGSTCLALPNFKTVITRGHYQASPCGVCGGHSGTGTRLSPISRISSNGTIPPIFHTHVSFIYQRGYGSGSSVGIATELRDGRSGIESRSGRDFPPVQTGPGAHPASCKMGTGSFPGVKCGQGVLLTTHPLLVPRS